MNEQLRESLSALLDDEANELELQRVLTQIEHDDELRDAWTRYSAARNALNGGSGALGDRDISIAVREAVANDTAPSSVITLGRRLRRPLASLAVAASVAITVVFGGQQLAQLSDGGNPADNTARIAASASPVGMLNSLGATPLRASFGTQSIPALQPATGTAYRELARQRMQKYMQAHAEQAALNSPEGLIPFARVPKIRE